MQILKLIKLLFLSSPESKVFTTVVRVVHDLPFGLILGTSFLRSNRSVISLALDEGFQLNPTITWVPLSEHHCCPRLNPLARRLYVFNGTRRPTGATRSGA